MEGRASGNKRAAFGPLVEILGLGFVETRWVGEWEDDWAGDVGGHFADDFFSKGARDGGTADQDVGFDLFNDGEEIDFSTMVREFAVVSSVGFLGGSEFVAVAFHAQTDFVDTPLSEWIV